MAQVRVATVKATGKRFIVARLDFTNNKGYLWGELTRTKGLSCSHESTKVFQLDALEIVEVERTGALIAELWQQAIETKLEAGYQLRVSPSGKTVTVLGKK